LKDIANIRKDYTQSALSELDVLPNAIQQFEKWWSEAIASEIEEPNAMTIATINEQGFPSARIVLVKDISEEGFSFFTNYNSDKGQQIGTQNRVALLFFWKELERQVRIEGTIEKLSAADSDAYFASRPRGSRIAAWSSPQSEIIADRSVLDERVQQFEEEFQNQEVPRPPHWGGYLVRPISIEFWQGRSSRMHDRLKYMKEGEDWKIVRLAP
jgi:pyridoxamine 5'-phosphate oxidase